MLSDVKLKRGLMMTVMQFDESQTKMDGNGNSNSSISSSSNKHDDDYN